MFIRPITQIKHSKENGGLKRSTAFLTAIALALLCGCGGENVPSSGQDKIEEIMNEADELNKYKPEDFDCFPDGVSLADKANISYLQEDSEGILDCSAQGVRFTMPQGYTAFEYNGNGDDNRVNPTCDGSVFLITPFFPSCKDYIRISCEGILLPYITPFEEYEGGSLGEDIKTKDDYLKYFKQDFEVTGEYFAAFENADTFDYIDITAESGSDMPSFDFEKMGSRGWHGIIYFACNSRALTRAQSKDSSISEVKCEAIELDNGMFGLCMNYDITRKGTKLEREVYWLYSDGMKQLRRIEFTLDTSSENILDRKAFLQGLEFFAPDFDDTSVYVEGK